MVPDSAQTVHLPASDSQNFSDTFGESGNHFSSSRICRTRYRRYEDDALFIVASPKTVTIHDSEVAPIRHRDGLLSLFCFRDVQLTCYLPLPRCALLCSFYSGTSLVNDKVRI